MKTSTITIPLDENLNQLLTRIARQVGKSRDQIAREAIRRHLCISQFNRLRRWMKPFAEARGYVTDEDVFRDVS